MKRTKLFTIAAVSLFVLFALGGFGSRASRPENRAASSPSPLPPSSIDPDNKVAASPATQSGGGEDEDSDPDLGKFHGNIDHEKYLRMRDEFVALKRGIEPGRPFDPGARGRAIEQMERQESELSGKSSFLGSIANFLGLSPSLNVVPAWTPLGPSPLPMNSLGSGPFSGRVTSVVVDPMNSSKVYLGTAQGGVWRSTDGGLTWVAIFDNAQSLAIGALALAPDHTTLYVGTGEFNGCGDCFFGVGLYRIDTVDTTPSLVGPINPQITLSGQTYNIFTGRGITKIVVDPTNANNIFVATGRGIGGSGANSLGLVGGVPSLGTRGLYRSMNATGPASGLGSVTFQKLVVTIDNSPDNPPTGNEDTPDIVMDPGNPSNVIVASLGPSGTVLHSGIYRTTNALASTPSFTRVLDLPNNVRVSLAINPVGPTVYAATSETPMITPSCAGTVSNPFAGAVRKSVDGGATWSGQLAGGQGFCRGQCFYDMPIAVDPNNANVVYVGGQTSAGCGGVVRKSTDAGASFADDSNGLHADDHSLFFDGGGNIYTGNDGGVWKRSSSLAAGSAWTNLNNASLNTLQFEGIAVHPLDRNLMIGGTQDNGTEYQQTFGGNWQGAESGDGGYALIDQSATDTTNVNMYHTFFNQTGTQIGFDRAVLTTCLSHFNFWPTRGVGFAVGGDAEQLTLSCDGTADYLHNGLSLTDNVLFYAPMALGPGGSGLPNTVYFGTDRLYRSTDRGDHMTVVSQAPISTICPTPTCPPNSTVVSPISTIAISPQDDNYRIVGMQDGQVWATSTGSSTMVNITSGSFPANPNGSVVNKFVGRAVIDPTNKDVAYVAFSFFAPAGQGVWKITNLTAAVANPASANWTAMGSGIPSIPINALVVDPANSNNIFAGTDIGVFNSTDGGASWVAFGTGLPKSAVFDLALQNANRILRAGTHGRGVWEISIGASPWQPTTLTSGEVVIKTWTFQSRTYAYVKLLFPDAGYRVSDWGQAVQSGINFTADATVEKFTGASVQALKTTAQIYDLGPLSAGSYNFIFKNSGTVVQTQAFTVSSGPPLANPIDDPRQFVRQQYLDFLSREPDIPGWDHWTAEITMCSDPANRNAGETEAQCVERKRANTSAAFFLSPEFQNTGYFVLRVYRGSLGRMPFFGGSGDNTKDEFTRDAATVATGIVVNDSLSPAVINSNKQAFVNQFVTRADFLAIYGSLPNDQYVDTLFQTTGITPTTTERNSLISEAGGAGGRASVLFKVVDGTTTVTDGALVFNTTYGKAFYDQQFNPGFVQMEYFGYMRRDPDDGGYAFWLGKLNTFGNWVDAQMVLAFINSPEYRARFGQP